MIVMVVAMIAIFYFLLIRPENKKKKAAAKMRSELAVGDQITTIGGIVGTICAVKEDTIVIETSADRVRVEFTKWAVSTKGTQAVEDGAGETKDKK
ncbi:preprotein translocase subunit YajC [uncultured Flavonifractor sp.]|uniref:preprotein translocase subunit YajC n=1 Tax=uncultured Flavonifractor sp. TaxID=1193534 RepID=UPI0026398B05|nr:preprotein translocase subunit YajC [uncultured Flavonifractor sp.]